MYETIVIASALFSKGETTRALIDKAKGLLDEGGRLVLVHVIEEIPRYLTPQISREHLSAHHRDAQDTLEGVARAAGDIRCEVVIRSGTPSVGILGTAKEKKADLIMLASHKPGFSDYFIGSTATRVVRHSPVSVMVMR